MSNLHNQNSVKNIRAAFFLNLSFTIIEIVGGVMTNSIAIISDALHDFGDSLSLGIAWILQKFSEKENDDKFSLGYRRFSLLAGLINCFVLLGGSILILSEAIPRLLKPEQPHAKGMFLLAVLGIMVNGIAVLKIRNGKSLNEKVVSWHLLEDVLGWFAVLFVSIILMFKNLPILDPILSILITLIVLFNVLRNFKKSFFVFFQSVPDEVSIRDLEQKIRHIEGVNDIHHTHVWSLDGEHHVLSIHLVVKEDIERRLLSRIKQSVNQIGRDIGVDHLTVEIEFGGNDCSQRLTSEIK